MRLHIAKKWCWGIKGRGTSLIGSTTPNWEEESAISKKKKKKKKKKEKWYGESGPMILVGTGKQVVPHYQGESCTSY